MSEDKTPVKYEKQGSYVAGLFTCPSKSETRFRDLYEDKLICLFSSIGIREGTIWIEVFMEGDDFFFNEVGYRYGGSFSFYSVDYVSRINQFYADLYYAITGDSQLFGFPSLIPSDVRRGQSYCIYPVHCASGKICGEKGIESILKAYKANIVGVPHQKCVGDIIVDSGSFGQVICLFHFVYETQSECREIVRYIQDNFRVIDARGKNMVNVMLNVDDI